MTSACIAAANGADTAPEFRPSINAATDEAWHSRVQWSTLVEPKPVRTSFWNRYASSFEPLAEQKQASAFTPFSSRILTRPLAAMSSASSQDASRKCVNGLAGSTWSLESFFAFGSRTRGFGRRLGGWVVLEAE